MFGDERMIIIYVQFNTSPLPFAFLGLSEWYQIMSEKITKQNPLKFVFTYKHNYYNKKSYLTVSIMNKI